MSTALQKAKSVQFYLAQDVAETHALCARIAQSNGEVSEMLDAEFSFAASQLARTVDRVAMTVQQLDLNEKHWREQARACQAMAQRFAKAQDELTKHIKTNMLRANRSELCGVLYRYVLSETQAKLVIDESKLDRSYLMQETKLVPDKEGIRFDLMHGATVEGAHLEPSYALRPYLNSNDKKEVLK
jgi:hypothetical protein